MRASTFVVLSLCVVVRALSPAAPGAWAQAAATSTATFTSTGYDFSIQYPRDVRPVADGGVWSAGVNADIGPENGTLVVSFLLSAAGSDVDARVSVGVSDETRGCTDSPGGSSQITINGASFTETEARRTGAAMSSYRYLVVDRAIHDGRCYSVDSSISGSIDVTGQSGGATDESLSYGALTANIRRSFRFTDAGGPTQAVSPPVAPAETLRFPAGATRISVRGTVGSGGVKTYKVDIDAGQPLMVGLLGADTLSATLLDGTSGAALSATGQGTQSVEAMIAENGSYLIRVSDGAASSGPQSAANGQGRQGDAGGASFSLEVEVPAVVRFSRGGVAAWRRGAFAGVAPVDYLLDAGAGQTMLLDLSTSGGSARIDVSNLETHQTYYQSQSAAQVSGAIHLLSTANYVISVVPAQDNLRYTLDMVVPPRSVALPDRPAYTGFPAAGRIVVAGGVRGAGSTSGAETGAKAVWSSVDDGTTWRVAASPSAAGAGAGSAQITGNLPDAGRITGAAFASATTGILLIEQDMGAPGGAGPVVLLTTDDGATWSPVALPPLPGISQNRMQRIQPREAAFSGSSDGTIVVDYTLSDGSVAEHTFATADGGRTWHDAPLPAYFAVHFRGSISGHPAVMDLERMGTHAAGSVTFADNGIPLSVTSDSTLADDGSFVLNLGGLVEQGSDIGGAGLRGRIVWDRGGASVLLQNETGSFLPALSERYDTGSTRLTLAHARANGGAVIDIAYPLPTGVDSASQKVSAQIIDAVSAAYADAQYGNGSGTRPRFGVPEAIIADFMKRHESFVQAMNAHGFQPEPWQGSVEAQVMMNQSGILALQIVAFVQEGGAHPNTIYRDVCIDTSTGAVIPLDALLAPGGRAALTAAAEAALRAEYHIAQGATLHAGGFFDQPFALTDNYLITPKGLLFTYNSYEIAPYYFGSPQVFVPYSGIAGSMSATGPLRGLIP